MRYSIKIGLEPEKINNINHYFWYIVQEDGEQPSNCGFGWAQSISQAAKKAEDYFRHNIIKENYAK